MTMGVGLAERGITELLFCQNLVNRILRKFDSKSSSLRSQVQVDQVLEDPARVVRVQEGQAQVGALMLGGTLKIFKIIWVTTPELWTVLVTDVMFGGPVTGGWLANMDQP
jgi:hypothetical protein